MSQQIIILFNINLTESNTQLTQSFVDLKLHKSFEKIQVCFMSVCIFDILGNERADGLARIGSDSDVIAPVPCVPLSKGWANTTIRSWVKTKHSLLWNMLSACRQTKLLIKEPLSSIEAAKIRCLKRKNLRTLVGVLTGHVNFNKHLQTMRRATNLCPSLAQRRFFGNFVRVI